MQKQIQFAVFDEIETERWLKLFLKTIAVTPLYVPAATRV